MDKLTGILVGFYCISVAYHKNGNAAVAFFMGQKDFVKWLIALMLIVWALKNSGLGALSSDVIALIMMAVGLQLAASPDNPLEKLNQSLNEFFAPSGQ